MRNLDNWTDAQKDVIKHSKGNLLVSASAGSGKTSVLIEKIVNLILDGQTKLKNLLVVTFTNSASQEIKLRLQNAIENSGDELLIGQLEDLSTSDILTFDAFCIKIVREFGYTVGQNGNFSVADTSLANFYKSQALDNVFSHHNKNFDLKFYNLSNTFFKNRNDAKLGEVITKISNFLKGRGDDVCYKNMTADNCKISNTNAIIKYLNNYILDVKNYFVLQLNALKIEALANADDNINKLLDDALQNFNLLGEDFLRNFSLLCTDFMPTMPKKSKKDTAEVLDVKDKYKQLKILYSDAIEGIITPNIKSLTINMMNDDLKKVAEKVDYIFDIVAEFDAEYEKIKSRHQVLDFVDIEQCANKILQNQQIATALQNRYDWLFVDEYQDTSALQEDIVKKVTTGENLFMVGDFKQSIYRFRQAEPKIFINKYNAYKKMQTLGKVLELKTNFRSDNAVLQFNNFVFDKIYKQSLDDFEYQGNADLEFGGKVKSSSAEPQINILLVDTKKSDDNQDDGDAESESKSADVAKNGDITDEQQRAVYSVKNSNLVFDKTKLAEKQALLLANEIKAMLGKKYYDAKTETLKPITYADIAVLGRATKGLLDITQKVLRGVGIPVQTSFKQDLFSNYDMQILLAILKTINNTKDDTPLIVALSNIGGLSFDDLAVIRQKNRDKTYFYQAVEGYMASQNDQITQKLVQFFDKIKSYQIKSTYMDICEFVLDIANSENLEKYFAVNGLGEQFESDLRLLINNIQSIKGYSLSEFINFVDSFGDAFSFDSTFKDGENAVTLCTIHASKGLEYPVVFLIGANKLFSTKDTSGEVLLDNDWGIMMNSVDVDEHTAYDNLIKNIFKLKILAEEKKEEKRLLYVALTRAKNYLTIIGGCNVQNLECTKTDFEISQQKSFLSWIMGCFDTYDLNALKNKGELTTTIGKTDGGNGTKIRLKVFDLQDFDMSQNKNNQPPKVAQKLIDQKQILNIWQKKFDKNNLSKKNSVTQILSEEEHYNISNFDVAKTDRAGDDDFLAIGTAYHKYMQLLDFNADANKIKQQIEALKNQHKILDGESELVCEDKVVLAVQLVGELIDKDDVVLKEQQFLTYMPANNLVKTTRQNKILVQGVADIIIIKPDQIYLIDYKTSRLKNETEYQQKYATQLDIYAKSIQSFYGKPVTKKMIYSFYLNKLITI